MENKAELISYRLLRKLIGILGIALPFVLMIGNRLATKNNCNITLETISHYYYSYMGDFFVGFLCTIGIFLFTYKGYDTKDRTITIIGGVALLLVAFIPTSNIGVNCKECAIFSFSHNRNIQEDIHLFCAVVFFISMAYMSIFQFTKKPENVVRVLQKRKIRNVIFISMGIIMILSIASAGVVFLYDDTQPYLTGRPIFICETIAVEAFGITWLLKGTDILKSD